MLSDPAAYRDVPSQLPLEPLIVPGEYHSLVPRWNAVVGALGSQPAITSPGISYSFEAADALSDRVAAALNAGLGDDRGPVALFVEHAADGLIGLLSILKTGRTIVVLDPHLPRERLRTICELAHTETCLSDAPNLSSAHELGDPVSRVLVLEELMSAAPVENTGRDDSGPDESGPDKSGPDDSDQVTRPSTPGQNAAADLLAAPTKSGFDPVSIVFTSGSTGRPKGVIQTHNLLLNDVYANGARYRITPQDRVALVLPYGFAAGLSVVFVALLNGAGVWSIDPREGGTRRLITWIAEQQLTTLHCTPHLLRSLTAVLDQDTVLTSLRLVSTVGEAVHGRDVAGIRPHLPPDCSFFNWSGSSEMGTLALHEIPGDADVPAQTVPAGRPIANKEVQIRREDGTLAGPGETGEIITISDYMSGGYWGDEEANAAKFSVHDDGRKVLRQGDLARFDDDGNLVLLGRSDAAIKVRGYLVEPSEVEGAFLSQAEVEDVVVVPFVEPGAPTRLVAYVVPNSSLRTQSPAALRRRLREVLPEYMVPAKIVNVTALPRNERGKVDRTQLPSVEVSTGSAPPSSQWELVVADLWGEVLGLDYVGLDDDFMALGGDSLSVEEMLASVQERLQVPLVSSDLIEAPTLREFTQRVTLGSSSLPSHPDVVTLRSGGSQTPLFCFAGSGALALSLLPISRHLRDRSVYAFQAHGLERRGIPDWTIGASARRYVEIIRILQPRGPYCLLGHSFGGLVALEIAHMLVDAGESVRFLGLLDTYLPRSVGQQPTFTYETLPDRPRVSTRASRARDRAAAQVQRLLPDGLPPLRDLGRRGRAYLAGVVPHSGQHQFDAFFDHGNIVSRRYRMKPYDGRTLLVLADENPDGIQAWQPLLTGSLEFVELASEHSSLLRDPHAATLAGILNAELGG